MLEDIRDRLDPANPPLLIFVNKGIEAETGALTLEIILDTCGREIATQATFLVCYTHILSLLVAKDLIWLCCSILSHLHAIYAPAVWTIICKRE